MRRSPRTAVLAALLAGMLLGWLLVAWRTSLALHTISLAQKTTSDFRSRALGAFRNGEGRTSDTIRATTKNEDANLQLVVKQDSTKSPTTTTTQPPSSTPTYESSPVNLHQPNNFNLPPHSIDQLPTLDLTPMHHRIIGGTRYLVVQSDSRLRVNASSPLPHFSFHPIAASILMMADWAKIHGYGYLFFDSAGPKCTHPTEAHSKPLASFWCKVPSLLYVFQIARQLNYSGVLFADSDVGPQIFSPPVLIDDVPFPSDKHVVLLSARDQVWGSAVSKVYKCGSVNSGVLFFRTTQPTWDLLRQWWFESTLLPTAFEAGRSYLEARIYVLVPRHRIKMPDNTTILPPKKNNYKGPQFLLPPAGSARKPVPLNQFTKQDINQRIRLAKPLHNSEMFLVSGTVGVVNATTTTSAKLSPIPPTMEKVRITLKFNTHAQMKQQDALAFKKWCCSGSPHPGCKGYVFDTSIIKQHLVPGFINMREEIRWAGMSCGIRLFNTMDHWPGDQDRLNHLACSLRHQPVVHISSTNDFVFGAMHKSPHAVLHHWVNPHKIEKMKQASTMLMKKLATPSSSHLQWELRDAWRALSDRVTMFSLPKKTYVLPGIVVWNEYFAKSQFTIERWGKSSSRLSRSQDVSSTTTREEKMIVSQPPLVEMAKPSLPVPQQTMANLCLFSSTTTIGEHQRLAIKSWLAAGVQRVVIMCDEVVACRNEIHDIDPAGDRVMVVSNPEPRSNLTGTVRLDRVLGLGEELAGENIKYVGFINTDIVVSRKFHLVPTWLGDEDKIAVGERVDCTPTRPIPPWVDSCEDLEYFVSVPCTPKGHGWKDWFIYPRGLFQRKNITVPPFWLGRPLWDHWIVDTVHTFAMDVSPMFVVCHVQHRSQWMGTRNRHVNTETVMNRKLSGGGFAAMPKRRISDVAEHVCPPGIIETMGPGIVWPVVYDLALRSVLDELVMVRDHSLPGMQHPPKVLNHRFWVREIETGSWAGRLGCGLKGSIGVNGTLSWAKAWKERELI